MSLEAWGIVASFGTFVVIAATAIAALVQLRHTRSANQIAAINEMRETLESERFTHARRFVADEVPKLLADPEGRSKLGAEILAPEIRDVGNFFEVMGAFVKFGIIDRALVCDLWDGQVYRSWKQLEPVVMIRRQRTRGTWTSFEYLAVLCEESLSKTQGDYYPRGTRRMTIDQRSLEAAAAFAKDQADAPSANTTSVPPIAVVGRVPH